MKTTMVTTKPRGNNYSAVEELKEKKKEEEARIDEKFAIRKSALQSSQSAQTRNRKLADSLTLSIGDIAYAMNKFKGVPFYVAEYLGTTRSIIEAKIEATPSLKKLSHDLLQSQIDIAQYRLFEQVDLGSMPAISLVLKTLGKERGFTEKSTVELEMGDKMAATAAALIDAMRAGATSVEDEEDDVWVEAKQLKLLTSNEPVKSEPVTVAAPTSSTTT